MSLLEQSTNFLPVATEGFEQTCRKSERKVSGRDVKKKENNLALTNISNRLFFYLFLLELNEMID